MGRVRCSVNILHSRVVDTVVTQKHGNVYALRTIWPSHFPTKWLRLRFHFWTIEGLTG
jgi:hypothetical protein